jgi:putative photosynthetic complex assembly protein 2
MTQYVFPIMFATLAWWLSTALIFFLDSLPPKTFRWSMLGASVVLVISFWVIRATAGDTTTTSAYLAFAAALVVWGWQEMSFYMGYITGPRKRRCAAGCKGVPHFGHAVAANIWHELAIILAVLVIAWMTFDEANQVGLWTYLTLWLTHLSARLNVFLGVRNINADFVPEHLQILKSFLRRRSMNLLFPFSITAITVIAAIVVDKARGAAPGFELTGLSLIATVLALAVLEHWFLMLPISSDRLWRWSLAGDKTPANDKKSTGIKRAVRLEPAVEQDMYSARIYANRLVPVGHGEAGVVISRK